MNLRTNRPLTQKALQTLLSLALTLPVFAQATSFVVEEGEVVGHQVLTDISDTGLIEFGGTISTTGNGTANSGVLMQNGAQSVTNDGTITTTGGFDGVGSAIGIIAGGPSSLVTNNGLIQTSGTIAHGIAVASTATTTTVINNGVITTSANALAGNGANGISSAAATSTLINNGEISTSGTGASGIASSGSGVFVRNKGLITSTGVGSRGIASSGADATIVNNGTIIANSDATSSAILLSGANPTLVLQRRSNIQGAVTVAVPATLEVQKGLNLALTTTGLPFSSITTQGAPFATSGNTVAVVDRTGFAMEVDILDDLTAVIMNNLGSQYCQDCNDCCESYTSDEWSGWVRGFGSYRERRLQHRTVKYDNGLEGGMAGLELPVFCDWTLGIFGGGSYGNAHVAHHSHVLKNTSGFGGLYLDGELFDNFFRFAITGGSLDQHSTRRVMDNTVAGGRQNAKTKLKGSFVAPELRYGRSFCLFGLEPIVSGDVRYSGLFLDSYKEKGSSANFRVKSHDIHLLTVSTELAVPVNFDVCDSCMTVTPYMGLAGRYRLGDKKLHGELLEQSITFYDGSWNQLGYLFVGFRSCHKMDCGLSLLLDLEGDFDNHKSALIRGGLKAEMSF